MYVRVASSPWSCGFWTGGIPVTTASNSFPQVGYQSSNIETIPPWYLGLVFTRNVSARGLFRYRPFTRSSRPSDVTAINRMSSPRGSAPISRANSSTVAVRPANRLNTSNRFATCSTLECQYAELIRATVIGSSALETDRPRGRAVLPFAAFAIRLPMSVSERKRREYTRTRRILHPPMSLFRNASDARRGENRSGAYWVVRKHRKRSGNAADDHSWTGSSVFTS